MRALLDIIRNGDGMKKILIVVFSMVVSATFPAIASEKTAKIEIKKLVATHLGESSLSSIYVTEIKNVATDENIYSRKAFSTFLKSFQVVPEGEYLLKYECSFVNKQMEFLKKIEKQQQISVLSAEEITIRYDKQPYDCNVTFDDESNKRTIAAKDNRMSQEVEAQERVRQKNEKERIMAIDKNEEARKNAIKSWEARSTNVYKVGDKVCTYKGNFFGNVEQINGSRIKVYVIGKVTKYKDDGFDMGASDGYFYNGLSTDFYSQTIEGMRWYEKDEISSCNFNAN